MSSFWRDCIVCGQKILMTQNHHGVWQPLEPDGGGRHEHWSGADAGMTSGSSSSVASTRSWSITRHDHSVTYRTKCWWCQEQVFFHTNGFGDCVLFDRLGWPWEVHACWAEYAAAQRSSGIARADDELDAIGFNGRFYTPRQVPVDPGRPGQRISVIGYVADNHALYEEPNVVRLAAADEHGAGTLTRVDVADNSDRLFSFLLPQDAAKRLDDYSLVRVTGVWRLHRGKPYLLATSYRKMSYDPKAEGQVVSWRLRHALTACYYCRKRLPLNKNWGFDQDGHPECDKCSTARGSMTPRQFLALCRAIMKRRSRR
jgi:hypothetical protein